MKTVTLYGKAGCCLCDEARAVIAAVRAEREFDLQEVDVSTDPVLNNRYGERIPVVEIDGELLSEYAIETVELETALDTVVP
jgi:glutaredoxin